MAQHDYVIANGTGAAVRSDLNNALAAIVSQNSGATAPATTYAFQFWADTTTGLLKLRNSANNAWVTLFQLDGEWSTLPIENGTAAAPSIYFKDSGTDTGFYSPGTDQVGISTGGTSRLTIDANGNLAVDTNTLYVDAPNNRVGIGTSSPTNAKLVVTDGAQVTGAASDGNATCVTVDYSSGVGRLMGHGASGGQLAFFTNASGSGVSERLRIDSSGRVGIGTTSPGTYNARLALYGSTADETRIALFQNGVVGTSICANGGLVFGVDGSTGGTERARIDNSGRLLVGISSGYAIFDNSTTNPKFQFQQTSGQPRGAAFIEDRGDADGFDLYIAKSRGSGTTIVNSADQLGSIQFTGADGTNQVTAAAIRAYVDGTPGADDMPGRLVFSTTADGASSPTERARIINSGYFKATATGTYYGVSNAYHEMRSSSNDWVTAFSNTHPSTPYGILVAYTSTPNNTDSNFLHCVDGTALRAAIRSNGGLANYSGNNVNLSDINTKKDISPAAGTWDCIKEWEIVNYRYKDQPDDADLNLGVIAQQVAESCPEVITVFEEAKDDQPEKLGVKEQQMYWMAIKALQEAQVRIEQLEAKVAALESA